MWWSWACALGLKSRTRTRSHAGTGDATAEKLRKRNREKFNVLNFSRLVKACCVARARVATHAILTVRWRRDIFEKLICQKIVQVAAALYNSMHFFAVLCKTATWNGQFQSLMENMRTRERTTANFPFLSEQWTLSLQIELLESLAT